MGREGKRSLQWPPKLYEARCVIACPAEARVFGDLSDPNSPVSELLANRRGLVLRPDFGTRPMVYYLK